MSLYQKSLLKNGTRVILVPSHDTQAVTVLVQFEVGSRYETARLSGASHFVEHMMFKGTEKRPTTMDISRDLDSVGADYNAFTGKDHTGYFIKLNAEKTPLAVDMLYDMLFHSRYDRKECDRERQVIVEEINMYEDNPLMKAEELLEELVYSGSTLERNIAGTRETMAGIDREMLVGYRDAHYVPSKTVITVAGKLPDDILPMLEETFGKVRPAARPPKKYARGALRTGRPLLNLKYKETEQIQFALGFPGFPYGHPKLATLSVLATILGGGMSSRLFTEVRERRGLAYSVRASVSPYQDVGNVVVQAGLNKVKIDEGLKAILNELSKVSEKGVTAEELSRAREFIKGKMILNLEQSDELADFFAKQELLQRKIETPDQKIAKFFAVSREDIRAVAREVFRTSRLSAAMIGPFKDREKFQKLMKV